jgi:biopolymer transport protein ExbD/biopolymer transport protein TolR
MPDVTPIVNVALVLLIIFMVVMPMIQEGIIVEMPKAQNTQEIVEQLGEESVVLAIQEDGSLYINLHQVERQDLKKELAKAYHGKEDKPIIIKGSRNLPYQDILELMEICHRPSGARQHLREDFVFLRCPQQRRHPLADGQQRLSGAPAP